MSLYIDLTEFLTHPITTGIQRISGEMCKYLPPGVVTPVRLGSDGYVALSPDLIDTIGKYFSQGSQIGAAEIYRLGDAKNGLKITISQGDTVLVPEVFDHPQRLAFFRDMSEGELRQYRFIVFDLLPVTHPEYFWADKIGIYEYYKLLRRASNCGFISQETSDTYHGRLKRSVRRDGVVLPLGSDSLGPRAVRPSLNRPLTFSILGTVEPRKNHELIFEAFEPLLRKIDGLRLSFIGKMGWVSSEFSRKVRALASDEHSGFRFHSAPDDGAIRSCIEQSRATIYVSAAEGYGLPPVESLWVGTPVIASSTIPSLKGLRSSAGIHYVEPLSVIDLRRAVLAFLDDEYANRKTEETTRLNLPTWQSFTHEVLRWCSAEQTRRASLVAT
jgi:glycosyltransferase involved in cell wall biosynthesis